ncbi:MAG TPA: hypothetical protein PKI68_08615, partial [Pontiellaceae bacterium]|nr:hypothetical protein [Pontiellaceae bacterium]
MKGLREIPPEFVTEAKEPSPWDFGNEVLYSLCLNEPSHQKEGAVIAKVWLIGRAYAAAIERRRNKNGKNDAFYVNEVAPAIIRSKIDAWINEATLHKEICDQSLPVILKAHYKVTQLFCDISGLEKRSLASKYLHFHQPQLFYIYDTRAVTAMRKLSPIVGRDNTCNSSDKYCDIEYRKFSEKCLHLHRHIKEKFQTSLNPRQIDNL